MLRFILTFAILCLTNFTFAEAATKDKLLEQLLEAKNIQSSNEKIVAKLSKSLSDRMLIGASEKGMRPTDEIRDIFNTEINQVVNEELIANEYLTNVIKAIYSDRFSIEELQQLTTFYSSELFRKEADTLPLLTAQLSDHIDSRTDELAETIGLRLKERIREHLKFKIRRFW